MSALIRLSGKYAVGAHAYAIVDDDQLEDLQQFAWFIHKGIHGKVYALRTWRDGGRKHFERMHRRVLGYTGNLDVDHINRNTLDNRAENLRAVTRSENIKNQEMVETTRVCKGCGVSFTFSVIASSIKRRYCLPDCKADYERRTALARHHSKKNATGPSQPIATRVEANREIALVTGFPIG